MSKELASSHASHIIQELRFPWLFLVRWLFPYQWRNPCMFWHVRIEHFDKTYRKYISHTITKTILVTFSCINVLKAFGEWTLKFPWFKVPAKTGRAEVCVWSPTKRKKQERSQILTALLEFTLFSLSTTVETHWTFQRSPWCLFDYCRHHITWSTQAVLFAPSL